MVCSFGHLWHKSCIIAAVIQSDHSLHCFGKVWHSTTLSLLGSLKAESKEQTILKISVLSRTHLSSVLLSPPPSMSLLCSGILRTKWLLSKVQTSGVRHNCFARCVVVLHCFFWICLVQQGFLAQSDRSVADQGKRAIRREKLEEERGKKGWKG